MNANSGAVTKVLDRIKSEGVDDSAIRTAYVTVFPVRQYNQQTGEEKLTGYRAQNSVTVTLKDAATIGKVLSAAVEAGANNLSGPVWRLRDDTTTVAEALKQATANARAKADALAAAQGVKVGDVLMMNENTVDVPSPLYSYGAGAAREDVAATPISASGTTATSAPTPLADSSMLPPISMR